MVGSLTTKLPWELANPLWASTLNPVLSNPLVAGNILSGIPVKSGQNIINHGLQRKLQGYLVIMNNAAITYFDTQSQNSRPELTLFFNASGTATISLYVF